MTEEEKTERRRLSQAERSRAWRKTNPERAAKIRRRSKRAMSAKRIRDNELYRELYGV